MAINNVDATQLEGKKTKVLDSFEPRPGGGILSFSYMLPANLRREPRGDFGG